MTISELLLPEFDHEMENTRKILALVPEDRFNFQPHPKSMTLGRLASHVAEMPGWVKFTLETESLDLDPSQKAFQAASRQELLDAFDKGVAEARQAIAKATDEELAKTWTLRFQGNTLFSFPRSTVLRDSVMNHMIHHRAQLGVYLRLNEVSFPGMYGPSADEMKMFQTGGAA